MNTCSSNALMDLERLLPELSTAVTCTSEAHTQRENTHLVLSLLSGQPLHPGNRGSRKMSVFMRPCRTDTSAVELVLCQEWGAETVSPGTGTDLPPPSPSLTDGGCEVHGNLIWSQGSFPDNELVKSPALVPLGLLLLGPHHEAAAGLPLGMGHLSTWI